MKLQEKRMPPNWGGDDLSAHINSAMDNITVSFLKAKETDYPLLRDIDITFVTIRDNFVNIAHQILEGLLFMRAHSAFRAACMLAMSGQNVETYLLLRGCLEDALYALHINRSTDPECDVDIGELWLDRHKDADSFKACKNKFRHAKVRKTLENIDSNLSKTVDELYQRTIDFGAHPNERAITADMEVRKEGNLKKHFMSAYLMPGKPGHAHALKTTAQAGTCSLSIFRLIFKGKFDILGVTDRLEAFKAKL